MQYSTRASLIGSESQEQELGGILLPLDWLDNSFSKSVRVCVCGVGVGVVNTMRGCYSRALQSQSTQPSPPPGQLIDGSQQQIMESYRAWDIISDSSQFCKIYRR